MKFNMELEDILYTMKNKDGDQDAAETSEKEAAPEAVSPPKPKASEEEADTPENNETPLAPPKPKTEAEATAEEASAEELVWFESKAKKKTDDKAAEKAAPKPKRELPKLTVDNVKRYLVALKKRALAFWQTFLSDYLPKMRAFLKKKLTKRNLTVIGAVILAFVLIFGTVKIVRLCRSATLKKYETQYEVEYPDGLRREYYDAFGENPSFAGNIVIKDTDTDIAVCSEPADGQGRLEKGSSVYTDQHYRAIALTSEQADLESVYASAEGYVDASQTLTFHTLFDDEKYHVIAAYYTNTQPADDNGYLFPYNCYGNFTDDSQFQYQDRIKTRSLYSTGYLIQPEDYCLTVSVDSDIMPGYRFVVVGVKAAHGVKKIRKTEENPDVHYPQSYCDMRGIHNRYWLAGHWYPEIYTDEEQTETQQLTLADFYTE